MFITLDRSHFPIVVLIDDPDPLFYPFRGIERERKMKKMEKMGTPKISMRLFVSIIWQVSQQCLIHYYFWWVSPSSRAIRRLRLIPPFPQ